MENELLRKVIEGNKHLEYLSEFDKEFESCSDRGIVLICGSIIESMLIDILKAYLLIAKE